MASAGSDGTCMSWHTGVYSTLQVCTFQGFSAIEMETNHEEFYDPIQYEYPAGELANEPFYNDRVPRQAQQSQRTTRDEAALTASISAFWLDFECLRDEDGEARSSSNSDDVYLICDVVRAAHSMIISVGPPVQDRLEEKKGHTALKTRRLGSASGVLVSGRFPSFCFVRGEFRVKLYTLGGSDQPKSMAKRIFAERAWDDLQVVVQLLDHFESSAILGPLQFIRIALD